MPAALRALPCCLLMLVLTLSSARAQQQPHTDLKAALQKSGANKPQLIKALQQVPPAQKSGMEFLITHMPLSDLQSLTADFLLDNVRLAYAAKNKTPWGRTLPQSVFFNDVLPYANIDEPRDPWRQDFMDRFLPVVADCRTASEAAQKLNRTVFQTLNVRYSTQRRRANQSPRECIETGLASCTGLSIVLTNACRAVGVPARLAGIPSWVNKRGNHTWVEIWDQDWHFTGAAEPSDQGLNHTWFQGDAALAQADSRMHSIYAVSYRPTGTTFPMVWSPESEWVHAVNVTDRYTPTTTTTTKTRLMIRVWNPARTQRVATRVSVSVGKSAKPAEQGTSRDESSDTNDLLTFQVPREKTCTVSVRHAGSTISQAVDTKNRSQIIVDIVLPRVTEK